MAASGTNSCFMNICQRKMMQGKSINSPAHELQSQIGLWPPGLLFYTKKGLSTSSEKPSHDQKHTEIMSVRKHESQIPQSVIVQGIYARMSRSCWWLLKVYWPPFWSPSGCLQAPGSLFHPLHQAYLHRWASQCLLPCTGILLAGLSAPCTAAKLFIAALQQPAPLECMFCGASYWYNWVIKWGKSPRRCLGR